jgi:hypothetical protein
MNTVADQISSCNFNRKPDSLKLASSAKSGVARAITFGSPLSRDKVHKLVREQMDAIRAFDRAKWGFDFHSERPTSDSKYDWKKVTSDSRTDPHSNSYSLFSYKHPSSFK